MKKIKWQIDEFTQCILDAEEIKESLKKVDPLLIQSYEGLDQLALTLHTLGQWLDDVLEDEEGT